MINAVDDASISVIVLIRVGNYEGHPKSLVRFALIQKLLKIEQIRLYVRIRHTFSFNLSPSFLKSDQRGAQEVNFPTPRRRRRCVSRHL